jgi:hydroxymethylbilane synthase
MIVKIGTRGSALALWQANEIKRQLEGAHEGLSAELVIFKTRGDSILDRPLSEVGGKGLFTKELEDALLADEIQLAVHSLKDMPTRLPDGLTLGAIPARADVRDVLIFRAGELADELKLIGTSSLRRACLAQRRWDSAEITSIRGNVPTRMGRVQEQGDRRVDGVLLAMAGILRLELNYEEGYDYLPLNPERWIPAVSQGALAIECRADDQNTLRLLAPLHDENTARCVRAERAFLAGVEGDCRVPVGGWATVDGPQLRLKAFIGSPDGREYIEGVRLDRGSPEEIGAALAEELLSRGGAEVLSALRSAD